MGALPVDHISFSQLTTVEACPYQYFLLKMMNVEPVDNPFAQAGSLAHKLLAAWAKEEVSIKELPLEWIRLFKKSVTAPFPPYLAAKGYEAKLFDSVLRYFETFDGFAGYEVLGTEQQFESVLAGERFVGIIDLILKDQKSGGLVIVDHKSAGLSSFKKNKDMMYRQLILYAKFCADVYGAFPERLAFNLFKEQVIDERPFASEDYMATRIWAEAIVEKMKNMELPDWLETNPEAFRCTNLCSCRNECCFGQPENHKRKEKGKHDEKKALAVV